jgi:hypothetical protein
MESYEIEICSLQEPLFNRTGIIEPLCNDCVNSACPFDIEYKTISIFGRNYEWRVYNLYGTDYQMVISCGGYMDKDTATEIESMTSED